MNKAMAKRQKLSQVKQFTFVYNIERSDTPGVSLDPSTMLSAVDCNEFFIVRQNSQRYTEHVQVKMLSHFLLTFKELLKIKLCKVKHTN